MIRDLLVDDHRLIVLSERSESLRLEFLSLFKPDGEAQIPLDFKIRNNVQITAQLEARAKLVAIREGVLYYRVGTQTQQLTLDDYFPEPGQAIP